MQPQVMELHSVRKERSKVPEFLESFRVDTMYWKKYYNSLYELHSLLHNCFVNCEYILNSTFRIATRSGALKDGILWGRVEGSDEKLSLIHI